MTKMYTIAVQHDPAFTLINRLLEFINASPNRVFRNGNGDVTSIKKLEWPVRMGSGKLGDSIANRAFDHNLHFVKEREHVKSFGYERVAGESVNLIYPKLWCSIRFDYKVDQVDGSLFHVIPDEDASDHSFRHKIDDHAKRMLQYFIPVLIQHFDRRINRLVVEFERNASLSA